MSVRAPLKPSPFETADTFELGRFKRARRAYGFDEVALVPGRVTINPEEVDSSFELGSLRLDVPILAAAMDGFVAPGATKPLALGKSKPSPRPYPESAEINLRRYVAENESRFRSLRYGR